MGDRRAIEHAEALVQVTEAAARLARKHLADLRGDLGATTAGSDTRWRPVRMRGDRVGTLERLKADRKEIVQTVSLKEAAALAEKSEKTMVNWARKDPNLGWKVGGRWRFDFDQLARKLAGCAT